MGSTPCNSNKLNDIAQVHNVFDDTNPGKVLGLRWDTHLDIIFAFPKEDAAMFSIFGNKARNSEVEVQCV